MVEGACLENRCTATYRGFESLTHRAMQSKSGAPHIVRRFCVLERPSRARSCKGVPICKKRRSLAPICFALGDRGRCKGAKRLRKSLTHRNFFRNRCLSTLAVFIGLLKPPVVGCLAGCPSHSILQEILLKNKSFLPLSPINSVVSEKSVEGVERKERGPQRNSLLKCGTLY